MFRSKPSVVQLQNANTDGPTGSSVLHKSVVKHNRMQSAVLFKQGSISACPYRCYPSSDAPKSIMTSFILSPIGQKGRGDLSQSAHCRGCISALVPWSHLKRRCCFSVEGWPLWRRCPTDWVSCPLCEALAICLICSRSDGCERNLQLDFQICVCVCVCANIEGERRKGNRKIQSLFKDLQKTAY